jgi:2'-5' RNA ligase
MIRTFVAVEPDLSLRKTLAKVQAELRLVFERARGHELRMQWIKPEAIHLTLKFLGNVPEEQLPELQSVLDRVVQGHTRFLLMIDQLGVFPHLRLPRILWVGMAAGSQPLARLVADVESAFVARGYARETKPFTPHLTLARVKDGFSDVGRVLVQERVLERAWPLGPLTVETVSLMKSELQPSGAVYTALHRAHLKEA